MSEPISLSHSGLQVLQSCPLRYKMSRIEGRSRIGITRGRRRGSAFSAALEHRDPAKIDELYEAWIMGAVKQRLVDDLTIERQVVAELYRAHADYFGDDDQREIPFEFPIEGAPGYVNRGFIDGMNASRGSDGELIVTIEEDKLMMMWGKADEAALPLDGQVLRYLGAAERLWPDAEIELRYRVTKYPGAYRKKDESARQYADKVCAQVREKAEKRRGDLFVVHTLRLSDAGVRAAVDRYHVDLTLYALEEAARRKADSWPGAWGSACKAFGGCEFLRACKQEPGFEVLYEQKESKQ